jgi:release factor glutamine methyltransferase
MTSQAVLPAGLTVAQARRSLADAFRQEDLESPELDARLLTGHVLGLDHTGLVAQADHKLDSRETAALHKLALRRLDREPIARIIGIKEFWGLPFRLNEATLVPRPETETVVEASLAVLDDNGPRNRALRIADLGTGSGALLVALLTELPNATGIGTDMSLQAIAAARGNAVRLGLASRAQFAAGDFGLALAGPFDLVVSNPPYIESAHIAMLPPEVRYDPHIALDGGADGLDAYRAIAGQARNLLGPGGHLVVEIGVGQETAVAAIFQTAGLTPLPAQPDLAGIPRALPARFATMTP